MRKNQIYRKPHGYKKRKPVYRNRFLLSLLSFFIFFASLFYLLLFLEVFQVKKINIVGLEKIQEKDVRAQMNEKLEHRIIIFRSFPIIFFETRSIFLVNSGDIKTQLLKVFPQIAEVKVNKNFPGTVDISIKERKGAIVWCQQEKCFSLDRDGIIFEENQQSENIISINDQKSAKNFSLGEKVIEKKDLENIFKVNKNLGEQIKIEAKSFNIFNDRLTVKTGDGWEIYFDIKGDIDWQLKKLGAVLEEKIPSEKRRNLDYIELRFGNLAPFRYK